MINTKWFKKTMAYVTQTKTVEVRPMDKDVVIKLEITLNVNMSTGQITVGTATQDFASTPSLRKEIEIPEFIMPKFNDTTELIEGFGDIN